PPVFRHVFPTFNTHLNRVETEWKAGGRQHVYGKVVHLLSPGEDELSDSAVRSFFSLLEKRVQWAGVSCGKSLLEDNLNQLVSNYSSSSGLQEDGFFRLAAGCCLFLSSASNTCTAIREGRWAQETDQFIQSMLTHDDHSDHYEEGLEKLLHDMEEYYVPDNVTNEHDHQHADPHTDLDAVLGTVIYHVLLGDCMSAHSLPEMQFFMNYIFNHFGPDNITVGDLQSLMNALNLGRTGGNSDNDHGHDHAHEVHDDGEGPRHAHEEPHVLSSSWNAVITESPELKLTLQPGHLVQSTCFSAQELLMIYRLNSSGLNRDQFTQLSPALIQQLLSKACTETSPITDPTGDKLSTTERKSQIDYFYQIQPVLKKKNLETFIFLIDKKIQCHIVFIVKFLGLHVHGEGQSDGHGHSEENSTYIFKLLVVVGGIYYFYLMETIFSIITRKNSDHHHHHHHHGVSYQPLDLLKKKQIKA
uniref:Zinc transporter ZIP4 N-terminal domain-containing protein n=1 Tax=Astyanax mexicanus TaxID=7994 RepID=A0A8B9H0H2_ASTMX